MLQASELSTAWKKEEMQMFDSKGNVIRSDKFVKFVLDAEEIREKINRLLGRYRIQPKAVELRLSAHRLFVRWHTSGFQALVPAFGFSAGVQQEFGEGEALMALLAIFDAGCLDRIKQCKQCKQWFFAKFSHMGFCSTKCQQAYHYSDEFREYRAAKMKKLRRDAKMRQLR